MRALLGQGRVLEVLGLCDAAATLGGAGRSRDLREMGLEITPTFW